MTEFFEVAHSEQICARESERMSDDRNRHRENISDVEEEEKSRGEERICLEKQQ